MGPENSQGFCDELSQLIGNGPLADRKGLSAEPNRSPSDNQCTGNQPLNSIKKGLGIIDQDKVLQAAGGMINHQNCACPIRNLLPFD